MNSPIAATTSREGTNHRLVRSTSRRQCDDSADEKRPRYMAGSSSVIHGRPDFPAHPCYPGLLWTMPRPVAHLANLDLNLLVALRELVRERSVTRAAERLGVTQPAASAALSRLRRHFGDELLIRDCSTSVRASRYGWRVTWPCRTSSRARTGSRSCRNAWRS